MRPASHARLRELISVLMVVFFPFVCLATEVAEERLFVAAAVTLWLLQVSWHFLPVRCRTPDCRSRMKREHKDGSFGRTRLEYDCPLCGDRFADEIWILTLESSRK